MDDLKERHAKKERKEGRRDLEHQRREKAKHGGKMEKEIEENAAAARAVEANELMASYELSSSKFQGLFCV